MQSGLRIRNQKDFAAGVIYVLAGAGFGIGAINYKVGDAARMGPGYFPLMIGILLTVIGLVTLFGSVRRTAPQESVKAPHLRCSACCCSRPASSPRWRC